MEWWDTLQGEVNSHAVQVSSQFLRTAPPEVEGVSSQNSQLSPPRVRAHAPARSEESEETLSTSGEGIAKELRRNRELTPTRREETLSPEEIGERLSVLLQAIQMGACAGYAAQLVGVGAHRLAPLIQADWRALSQEEGVALCRKAGPVTTLALLVDDYSYNVRLLAERGEDVWIERAGLAAALAHRTNAGRTEA